MTTKLELPREIEIPTAVEPETCEECEGYGSISYNPNLNPNSFHGITSALCSQCDGTGSV